MLPFIKKLILIIKDFSNEYYFYMKFLKNDINVYIYISINDLIVL